MNRRNIALKTLAFLCVVPAAVTHAQDGQPAPVPVVTVSASSTTTVPNDRLHAWLRAEAENPSAAAAAAEVNARVARVLAKLKALPDAQVSTSGYTSQQVVEKGKPARWRIVQTIKVEGRDFAAIGDAVARVQAEDGALLSGISFGVSDELRRRTQDAITEQAIAAWRARAQAAAHGFGIAGWRAGRITIQAGDPVRPYPMMARGDMAMAAAAPAPVPLEAGTTEVSVSVSGEAILDGARAAGR
ncbi:MAG: SIMPL domain-containing protein [Burkholderiales bacterium]|nr:SIMPL domain-containing protein [Burkholderiales bacterium]